MNDQSWIYSDGIIDDSIAQTDSITKIFDILWSPLTEHIVSTILSREGPLYSSSDVNLFLASILVTGLSTSPEIELYFKQDTDGIFGNQWMQEHFTAKKWHHFNSHLHFDPTYIVNQTKINFQAVYSPTQILIVDEMILPFQGRWKHIQFVKGKPHNTGL